jgi:hypothetical protein
MSFHRTEADAAVNLVRLLGSMSVTHEVIAVALYPNQTEGEM